MTELSTITLYRRVRILSVVTPELKNQVAASLEEAIRQSFVQYQAIEEEAKRMIDLLKKEPDSAEHINKIQNQLKIEYQAQFKGIANLKERLSNVQKLQEGSLFEEGDVDSLVQLKAGDSFYDKMRDVSIVLKDGVIQKITEELTPSSVAKRS